MRLHEHDIWACYRPNTQTEDLIILFIIYLKEFMASDWLIAMYEIIMSNEWRLTCDATFLIRHANDDDINFWMWNNTNDFLKYVLQPVIFSFFYVNNKTIDKFGFHMIWRIIKRQFVVIKLSFRLRLITTSFGMIILHSFLNRIQYCKILCQNQRL